MTFRQIITFGMTFVVLDYMYKGALASGVISYGRLGLDAINDPIVHAIDVFLSFVLAVSVALRFYKGASA